MLRVRLLTLLTIVVSLALTLAACGGGDEEGGGSSEASDLLERSYKKTVTSGDLDLNFEATLDGFEDLEGPLKLTLSGPYAQDSPTDFPVVDWDVKAEGAGRTIEAGIIVTEDNAFVEYQGETYEVGTELFSRIKEQQESQPQAFTPQGLKALGIDVTKWLPDAEVKDGDDIGGDSTKLVTGDVDLERVIKDQLKLLQSPAVRQALESRGLTVPDPSESSEEDIKKIEDAIDRLELQVNVDEEDYVRRTFLDADFTVPEGSDVGELKGGSVSLDYTLNEVGIEPKIEAPTGAKPIQELLGQLGLGATSGGGSGGTAPPGALPTP